MTFTLDQDKNLTMDRRFEASITEELSVPSVNGVVGQVSVGTASITSKALLGQQFCFTDLNLDENTKKMAQAGFVLETMSVAGLGLSPVAGPILAAIVTTINQTSGVSALFEDALVKDYWGVGLEGSVGAGFKLTAEGMSVDALTSTVGIALNFKFNSYHRNFTARMMKNPSPADIDGRSIELAQAFTFNFSTLNFGFSINDI